MKQQVNPSETTRANAFNLWMSSPMPMVTLTKTLDVTRLIKYCKKYDYKFNMLLCWTIGQAASKVKEFYMLPEKGGIYRYDELSINVIVPNVNGGINSCDIQMSDTLNDFNEDYLRLTNLVSLNCKSQFREDTMVIGTSAMIQTELDTITNQYTDTFLNPMLLWGKYRRKCFRYKLPVSFQFHHVQMDGMHGAMFLEELQKSIDNI
ncbi:MAG: CatA-like O-acetyltransferase, family 2 [Bacteroidaceae bacterium]|nr:CatA-like O-acetyltransferase, family 2 [Bacteroidaceae bacterium]